ncbi:hypothetical protein [Nannocystis pusilla]|uniref:hypothetical protein n=1 Tax=Nannocystis pusilla TaxID=889268 RepID=UPI003DA4F849
MVARSKVLRIASIIDGLVCDELHQSAAEAVTAGTDVGNQLVCFGPAVPKRHVLFIVQEGRYVLDLPPRVGGQLVMRGRSVNLGQLWRKRLREDPRARSLRVVLDPSARGKLDVGETTLLFQFAAPQPVPPKPPFPEEFKARPSNMWTRHDMATLMAAFMLFGPYFIWASNKHIDYAIEPEIDERFLRVMNLDKPKKKEPEEEKKEEEEEVLAKEDEKLTPKPDKVIDKPVLTQKTYSKESMDKARGVGIARVLGTYGGDGPGTVFERHPEHREQPRRAVRRRHDRHRPARRHRRQPVRPRRRGHQRAGGDRRHQGLRGPGPGARRAREEGAEDQLLREELRRRCLRRRRQKGRASHDPPANRRAAGLL